MNSPRAQIGVDVGYGYTKAVSISGKQACFPSAIAPPPHDVSGGFFKNSVQHTIEIDYGRGTYTRLVGNAALESSWAMTAVTRRKPEDMHDYLLFAAAYMVGASVDTEMAIGLPLAYYKTQKDHVAQRLRGIDAWVSVDGKPERRISFGRVVAIPQGVGALLAHMRTLPQQGLVGVMDIGTHTTDYLLLEMLPGEVAPRPLKEYCGSAEIGVKKVQLAIAAEYNQITGGVLSLERVSKLTNGQGNAQVIYEDRRIDLTAALDGALDITAKAILNAVKRAWDEKGTELEAIVLCGGGADLFAKYLLPLVPRAVQVPNPIYANALGYLSTLKGEKGSQGPHG